VFADSHQTDKLERLCRYISRPALSEQRLSLTDSGKVRYQLKTPYQDGTTHVFFTPLDFIGKLAALVPVPRLNLTRFYGVFAPNAKVRAEVTASQRGKNSPRLAEHLKDSDKPYHARSMSWAQRLKRVFNIDITVCEACEKTNVKIITCITDPAVIHKILAHLDKQTLLEAKNDSLMPPLRAPPATASFSDYIIQRDFDFGAWSTKNRPSLEHATCWGKGFHISHCGFQYQRPVILRLSWWQLLHWFLKSTHLTHVQLALNTADTVGST